MNTVTATAGALPKSFKDVWLISAGHGLGHESDVSHLIGKISSELVYVFS